MVFMVDGVDRTAFYVLLPTYKPTYRINLLNSTITYPINLLTQVRCRLVELAHLISKYKPSEDDKSQDFVKPVTTPHLTT